MTTHPTKSLHRRLRKLEVCFESRLVTIEQALDPFSDEAIVLRLASGEWKCAMKLLDGQQCEVCQDRPLDPKDLRNIDFRDLTRLRQMVQTGVGHLPWDLRERIAHQLIAAEVDRR